MPDQIPGVKHIRLDFVVKGSVETIIGSEVCQLLNVFKKKLTFINTESHERQEFAANWNFAY